MHCSHCPHTGDGVSYAPDRLCMYVAFKKALARRGEILIYTAIAIDGGEDHRCRCALLLEQRGRQAGLCACLVMWEGAYRMQ